MRDLDQLQEHELDDRSRQLGAVAVAALGVTVLALAVGMAVTRPSATEIPAPAADPLDVLGPLAAPEAATGGAASEVAAVDLTFPEALTGEEERPEVLAALRAAALEEASLAEGTPEALPHPDDIVGDSPRPGGTTLPAVVAAGDARSTLAQVANKDPLIAAAIDATPTELAPGGAEGLYTLHVISYDNASSARRFVRDLRARGHHAFVVEAHVEGRGPTWRVRIGPFENRRDANEYRATFEAQEGMNTHVVRRETDKPAA